MSDDMFSVLTDEEMAEYHGTVRAMKEAGIDTDRIFRFALCSHKVLSYMTIQDVLAKLPLEDLFGAAIGE